MRRGAILAGVRISLLWGMSVVCGSAWCMGQVVQLPTFQNTNISTVVEVPSGGSAYLGGIGRAGATTAARRTALFGQRSGGIYASGSGNSVVATVIDLKALDQAILNQNLAPGYAIPSPRSPLPLSGRHHPGTNYRKVSAVPGAYMQALGGDSSLTSTSGLHADTAADIRELMEKAQNARQGGRYAAAEVYYRMIIERLPADIVKKLEAEVRNSAQVKPGSASVK